MARTRALVHLTICTLALWGSGAALGAQVAAPAGDSSARPVFPPRGTYNHGHDVQDRYEPINDVTRVFLDLGSNNVLPLLYGPIVQLTIESRYQGAAPVTPPESVLVTVRVFRMRVSLGSEGSVVARTLALSTAIGNPPPPQPTRGRLRPQWAPEDHCFPSCLTTGRRESMSHHRPGARVSARPRPAHD